MSPKSVLPNLSTTVCVIDCTPNMLPPNMQQPNTPATVVFADVVVVIILVAFIVDVGFHVECCSHQSN